MLFEEVFLSIVLISSIGAAATSVGVPWCWPRLDAARSVLKRASTQLADRATRVEWQTGHLIIPVEEVRLLAPVQRPGQLIVVGSNNKSHLNEAGDAAKNLPPTHAEKHDWSATFSKFPSVVVGPGESIPYPAHTEQFDYQAELCVVIQAGPTSLLNAIEALSKRTGERR